MFKARSYRLGIAAIAAWLLLGPLAVAQSFNFEVENGLVPNEVVISTQRPNALADFIGSTSPRDSSLGQALRQSQQGTFRYSGQVGEENSTLSYLFASPGAGSASEQQGSGNSTRTVIADSPQSVTTQFQLGSGLSSDIVISGGHRNAVGTAQIGNNLGISVGLIDSVDTTIVYGQAGEGYRGSIVFRNAPAGTVITLQ